LGAAINQSLQKDFVSNGVTTKENGIWILKATECPAVLLECGYLTNVKDLSLLNSKEQRIKMGQLILEGVEQYLKNIEAGVMNNTKSIHDKKVLFQEM
jgi:N-acetylmuramoyl-L-alanine amidase